MRVLRAQADAPMACSASDRTYIVVGGDTLQTIASRSGTSASALASYNHLANPNLIYTDQPICLPAQTWDENASTSSKLPHPTFDPRIEDYASYKGRSTCDPTAKPGVMAFRDMLLKAFSGTKDDGIVRACSLGGPSEHKEGRTWDWMVSAQSPADVARVNQAFA